MKKWLVLTICACLLTGCTRYNPIDITDSALENASPSEPGSADTTDGTGADDGAGTSDSDEAEEPVLQITDDDPDEPAGTCKSKRHLRFRLCSRK